MSIEENTKVTDNTQQNSESMDDYKQELEASFRKIKEGDIVSGTVIHISDTEVTLDLKYYASGIIPFTEFSSNPAFDVSAEIHIGDFLQATVTKSDDGEGNILLSVKEANDVLAWSKFQEYLDNQTNLTVKVGGLVPKGVIAYLEGIRGFIPASHLALSYTEPDETWINKSLTVRVITVDESLKKLVLSAKVVLREQAEEEHRHKIGMMIPGSIMNGTVESLMPYGAFVRLESGISGLIHISQISQKRINHPSEVLTAGQEVKVKILNTNDGKVSLSMKALQEEMVDTASDPEEAFTYTTNESVSTSLGDLLKGFQLPE